MTEQAWKINDSFPVTLAYEFIDPEGVFNFHGPDKIIKLSAGTVTLDVRALWSRWVDWFLTDDNSKYLPAFVSIGGDEIDPITGTRIPVFVFLTNGWRIRPQNANHTLNVVSGILLVFGGGDPFVATIGPYVVGVRYSQPVQAISFDTGSGGGGATPEQIWSHTSRTITDKSGFSLTAAYDAAKTAAQPGNIPSTTQIRIELEASTVFAKQAELLRAMGLLQENQFIDQNVYTIYQNQKYLTSGRIRTYSNQASVGSDNNVLATYTITAVWDDDEMVSYKVVKL